ncbi:MAG: hypothetical protein OEY23_12355 [Acidimicrobiia bacterium]|nr:hypothetical protein [Acidimicrobiia bacterium]
MPSYRMHGLTVDSAIPLDAGHAEVATGRDAADLRFVAGCVDEATPVADPLLSWAFEGGTTIRLVETGAGYLLTFADWCRFEFDRTASRVVVESLSEHGARMVPVLLNGWVVATALHLRGHHVLHASAVTLDGVAVAFMGNSGMGKSTIAALLTLAGATLLADDVLRVDCDGRSAWAQRGVASARLRPAAQALALAAGAGAHESVDGRIVLSPPPDQGPERVPLGAVVVPWPSRDADEPSLDWLSPPLAVVELGAYPRVYEWHDAAARRRDFGHAVRLSQAVRVAHLRVPWTDEWDLAAAGELGDRLVALLREELA